MDFGLKGRVALVTGASSGIGKAIALAFAAEGVRLAIASRSQERLKAASEEIRPVAGVAPLLIRCDVTSEEEIRSMIAKANSELGKIDILVCNAGGPPSGNFESFSSDDWDNAFKLNLKSTVNLCKVVVPTMKTRKWGRIINITSIAALQPADNLMLSNSVRAGVHGFTKSLSNEVASFGITVNCICPGYTRTERLNELAEQISKSKRTSVKDVYADWQKAIPMDRLADPMELGYLAAFLASERAAYITGVAINIDGGFIKSI
jgi:3-oxoacyl-[acyl-carrier protein] reductase